ncbi:MAG: V-type ATP synthase subunit E [Clostridia bacterium]|nr:V-type ATP synthase subunit E [Clostridia bacterium]
MISEPKNLENIIKEINKAADTAVNAIKKETAAYIRSELKKAERRAKQEITAAQFSELDKLNEQTNTDLSVAERNETRALLQRRSEITDEVFAEAAARIAAFTQTDGYRAFLLDSAKQLCALMGADSVFYLRPEDERHFHALNTYCADIRADSQITLGGIRAVNESRGLLADDTLDSRLAQQRQTFYETSGVTL